MNNRILLLLAVALIDGPLAANTASAQQVLLYSQTFTGGGCCGNSAPGNEGGGVDIWMSTSTAPIGTEFSATCLGCANNLGVGTTWNITEDFTAQNSANFGNFVSLLTSSDPARILWSGGFLIQNGQVVFPGGGGEPVLLSSADVNTVTDIQLDIANYSLAISGGVLTYKYQGIIDIYGTPGPAYDGPINVGPTLAPEIDPASTVGGLTLLLGGLAVLRGRRAKLTPSIWSALFSRRRAHPRR